MADYQKMYYILFNAMSETAEKLLLAMREAEEVYISTDLPIVKLAENPKEK